MITFASDAHTTDALASNFYEAMAGAEHFGFRQALTQRTSGPADSARWRVDAPMVWQVVVLASLLASPD